MSCGRFESLIALDVEGDLPARRATRLARHLEGCAGCRQFAEEMRESQAWWKLLKLEAPPASVVADVRWPKPGRTRHWPWMSWAPLAATAGLLLAVMAPLISRRPELAPPKLEIAMRNVEPPTMPAARAKAPVRKRRRAPKAEPLLVKLVTDDPQVVIYWLVEQKEGKS
jgi:hypothetical protein